MANQELRVGSRWEWMTPYELTPFTYIAPNRIRYDGETQGHWDVSADTIVARAVPLLAPAAPSPECNVCGALGRRCISCQRDDALAFEGAAPRRPPPPRCAPGCSPARACYTPSVCPAFEERRLAGYNYGHGNDDTDVPKGVPSDIPPAREPRIGALSWGYAAVCGGLSTRRGR